MVIRQMSIPKAKELKKKQKIASQARVDEFIKETMTTLAYDLKKAAESFQVNYVVSTSYLSNQEAQKVFQAYESELKPLGYTVELVSKDMLHTGRIIISGWADTEK